MEVGPITQDHFLCTREGSWVSANTLTSEGFHAILQTTAEVPTLCWAVGSSDISHAPGPHRRTERRSAPSWAESPAPLSM